MASSVSHASLHKRQMYNIIDGHNCLSEMRIVMLGKTGVGKSSVANTILGEDVFKIGHTVYPGTSECRSETRRVDGRDVTLIDPPGLFDTGRSEEKLEAEIVKCITECSPGPHAFIIVFKVEPFTVQEQEVINKIIEYFSEEAFKYATVLFTHGNQLDEGETIEEYFHNNHLVSDLVEKCGGRCHVIDNKYWKNNQPDDYRSNQFQVKQLMKTIDHMIQANKGSCFTNEMLQAVEKLRQEEEEKIRQSPGNKTEEEIREEKKSKEFQQQEQLEYQEVLKDRMPLRKQTHQPLIGPDS
uniref:AIG1-type G domain-containing protein n=1 Tax=Gasterosteus aculeatus aculeatus TaxID=481459 RepID=G3Q5D0_GASAC